MKKMEKPILYHWGRVRRARSLRISPKSTASSSISAMSSRRLPYQELLALGGDANLIPLSVC